MSVKAILFGVDDLFNELKPYYNMAIHRGDIDIVGHAIIEQGTPTLYATREGVDFRKFAIAIISSEPKFYDRMKMLEKIGVPRSRIIDGLVFKVPNLNFSRLMSEGIAYGVFEKSTISEGLWIIHPRHYDIKGKSITVALGTKSYIAGIDIEGNGSIDVEKFSCISWDIKVVFGQNADHNYKNVSMYGLTHWGWNVPPEFYPPGGQMKIHISNDVWIGRGCIFKVTNPNKPLIIGDGAVIAADSVVVKSVPPYAIVGGNPAQIIKYRFPDKIIEALLRIKWWDWDIDKIHDNFKYFNRVEEFVEMQDVKES